MVLDDQPGVKESAVIGIPHDDLGEAPLAVLVRGYTEPNLEAITTTLGEQLARFKCPRKLMVVDALPRNTMGKVQKNLLRDRFADVFKN